MKWIANPPVVSNVTSRLSAHEYKADLTLINGDLSFEDGDLKTVSGIDSFKQHVMMSVLTTEDENPNIGTRGVNLFKATSQSEFNAEAEILAQQLASQYFTDPILNTQDGLGKTIESILSISRVNQDGREYLNIELTATGCNEPLTVSIPIPYYLDDINQTEEE
jgi:hypothetical protein